MPNIKSAKKKVKQDKKRTARNESYLRSVKNLMKSLFSGGKADVKKAYSAIDKAAKKKVIHKNRAARLKSRVSKLASKKK